jgi:hypothetical protein
MPYIPASYLNPSSLRSYCGPFEKGKFNFSFGMLEAFWLNAVVARRVYA